MLPSRLAFFGVAVQNSFTLFIVERLLCASHFLSLCMTCSDPTLSNWRVWELKKLMAATLRLTLCLSTSEHNPEKGLAIFYIWSVRKE